MPLADISLEGLTERVRELERRVAELEVCLRRDSAGATELGEAPAATESHAVPSKAQPATEQPGLLPLAGRGVLGIAGAYFLRSLAESGTLPPWAAVSLGLIYASGWLVWAAWRAPRALPAQIIYSITSALIFAPITWEATVRFHMLEPSVTAALLAGYAVLGTVLSWRCQVRAVAWAGVLSAALAGLGLMAATRSLLPFAGALLLVALASESTADRGRIRGLRPFAAVVADLATLIVIVVLGDLHSIPSEYSAVPAAVVMALAVVLFALYAASAAIRTMLLKERITAFEAGQFAVAAVLAGWAVARATSGTGLPALGVCCLVAGAASYLVAFAPLEPQGDARNFHFFATCAVAWMVVGSWFALPPAVLAIGLCAGALAGTGLGMRSGSSSLAWHGGIYLGAAMVATGMFRYAVSALAGTFEFPPGATACIAAATALGCTLMGFMDGMKQPGGRWLRLLPTIFAIVGLGGLGVAGLAWLFAPGAEPSLPQLAVIRTAVTCATALLLGFVGGRSERRELVWVAYTAAGLGSVKLLAEDLRLGTTRSLAASLVLYGVVLILIPRLVRARHG